MVVVLTILYTILILCYSKEDLKLEHKISKQINYKSRHFVVQYFIYWI